jgi:hypothetical protein
VNYISALEARQRESEIRAELASLLSNKALVGRPRARQWRFFTACVEMLLSGAANPEFQQMPAVQLAQLKFEVEDRLRRFYLRPGRPVRFVFGLAHVRNQELFDANEADYPAICGYRAFIRDFGRDYSSQGSLAEYMEHLERVVTEAIDAEFFAYKALPDVQTGELDKWFCADGPAYLEIANVLNRHRARGWTISNPLNPSTKRLIAIKVKRMDRAEATVSTVEYWYLRWWSEAKRSYVYSYRETNRQVYVLRSESGTWRVYQNLRPSPRMSAPNRRAKR